MDGNSVGVTFDENDLNIIFFVMLIVYYSLVQKTRIKWNLTKKLWEQNYSKKNYNLPKMDRLKSKLSILTNFFTVFNLIH